MKLEGWNHGRQIMREYYALMPGGPGEQSLVIADRATSKMSCARTKSKLGERRNSPRMMSLSRHSSAIHFTVRFGGRAGGREGPSATTLDGTKAALPPRALDFRSTRPTRPHASGNNR